MMWIQKYHSLLHFYTIISSLIYNRTVARDSVRSEVPLANSEARGLYKVVSRGAPRPHAPPQRLYYSRDPEGQTLKGSEQMA